MSTSRPPAERSMLSTNRFATIFVDQAKGNATEQEDPRGLLGDPKLGHDLIAGQRLLQQAEEIEFDRRAQDLERVESFHDLVHAFNVQRRLLWWHRLDPSL